VAVNANENHWTFVCFFLSAAAKLVLDRGIQWITALAALRSKDGSTVKLDSPSVR
jgi:hypothetical protein